MGSGGVCCMCGAFAGNMLVLWCDGNGRVAIFGGRVAHGLWRDGRFAAEGGGL